MKRGTFKYYLGTFLMVFVFVLIMLVIAHAQGTYLVSSNVTSKGVWSKSFHIFLYKNFDFVLGNYLLDLLCLFLFPLAFSIMFFMVDKLTGLIKPKNKKTAEQEQLAYEQFVDSIGASLNKVNDFNVEDFRHFRNNSKFQECLKKLYLIYRDGELENVNYSLVLRKFEKGTVERNAIEYLITFTKKKAVEDKDKIEALRLEREAYLKEQQEKEEKKKRKKEGK